MLGIGQDTKSTNNVSYDKGGIKKAYLTEVKYKTVGSEEKNNQYNVLSFSFIDEEGIKTFEHNEFPIPMDDSEFDKRVKGLNSRIKHIYETYQPFPSEGIGMGLNTFEDFFKAVETAFNTNGKEGSKIFKNEKGGGIKVYIKVAYYNKKGTLGFPLSPNFIERIKENNLTEAKTLIIDKRFDRVEQPEKQSSQGAMGGGPGGITTGQSSDADVF